MVCIPRDRDADTFNMKRPNPVRLPMTLGGCLLAATLSGCALLPTPADSSMAWTGKTPLSDTEVTAPIYQAVAADPDLSVKEVMDAFDLSKPTMSNDESATGKGWSTNVTSSEFATRVGYTSTCEGVASDEATAIAQARDALERLGQDPTDWHWFAIPAADGAPIRVVAEPDIDGVQTWATGLFAAQVDAEGVCEANGLLMAFEDTEESTKWLSADAAFDEARRNPNAVIAGDYTDAELTYTLASAGRLVPLWRFIAEDHAIIAVDLGEGLETAPDTETSLGNALAPTE